MASGDIYHQISKNYYFKYKLIILHFNNNLIQDKVQIDRKLGKQRSAYHFSDTLRYHIWGM